MKGTVEDEASNHNTRKDGAEDGGSCDDAPRKDMGEDFDEATQNDTGNDQEVQKVWRED